MEHSSSGRDLIIYCITSPSGKKYIGQTRTELKRRWYMHRWFSSHGKGYALGAAIRKYGERAFSMEVLGKAEDQPQLDKMEQDYIREFDTMNPEKGYNLVAGGEGGVGWWAGKKRKPISPEHAEKLHASRRGKPLSKIHRKRLSKARMGKFPMNVEHKEMLRNLHLGVKLSKESIAKREATVKINLAKKWKPVIRRANAMIANGKSRTKAAAKLGVERHTLAKWIKYFK